MGTNGANYKIIDTFGFLPTEEVFVDTVVSTPPQMSRYLKDVFGSSIASYFGIGAEELHTMYLTMDREELKKTLAAKIVKNTNLDDFVKELDEMGVEKVVLFHLDEETTSQQRLGLQNDYYADVVRRYPDKFIGMAGIDPLKGMNAVREIRRSFDLGLRGVVVRPFMARIPPNHAKMYPIYSTCVELDIPVWLHTSINYSSLAMEVERPIYLDFVAQDFPELKIIAGHGGWPWVNEVVAVALRNPNVYIDIASYLPKYIGMRGTGWGPLLHLGDSILQDRILFGSTWLLMGKTIKELADGVMNLPLKAGSKRKWLYENAARLFGVL